MTMTSSLFQIDASDPAALAALIHDDVLQSLGVAVQGVDQCRRLHQKMRYEQALAELDGIVEALGQALASSEQLLPDLDRLLPASSQSPARPSLVVLDGEPAGLSRQPERAFPVSGPHEIVDTLTACLIQARRCRGQYDAGLGEETMRDLELMLQRLEFVSVAFRTAMGQLRQQTAKTLMPQPLPAARPSLFGNWTRTA
jgi:hypothetical protein